MASLAASAASTAPRCASEYASADWLAAQRYNGSATLRAPPNQQAATPMAPCQKPGRFTYAPGSPTATACALVNWTGLVSLPAIPAFHHVLGNALTVGSVAVTANRPSVPSSSRAVTSAWVQNPAPAHQTLVPFRLNAPSMAVAVSAASGASAAHTPHSWPGSGG